MSFFSLQKTDADAERKGPLIRWGVQTVAAPAGWNAVLIPQSFPVPADRRVAYLKLMATVRAALPEVRNLQHEAFIQMDRIQNATQAPKIRDLGSALGDYGLGYYPDQPPPTTWTREEIAALFPPAKLRPLFTDVMRAESSEASIQRVAEVFAGSGAYTEAFCAGRDSFYQQATDQFKPLVASRKLRMFPYYAPVLTRRAIEPADSKTLGAWTCDARLYLRESVEDNGVLILRSGPLRSVFQDLAEQQALPGVEFAMGWAKDELDQLY